MAVIGPRRAYLSSGARSPLLNLNFGLQTYYYNGVTYASAAALFSAVGSYTGGVAGATVTRGDGTVKAFAAANVPRVSAPSSVTNLLTQSNALTGGSWGFNSPGSGTITANAGIAPDGSSTASNIVCTGVGLPGPVHNILSVAGQTYTDSIYIKDNGGTTKTVNLGVGQSLFGGGGDKLMTFNVSTGVLSGINAALTSQNVTSVGNGWWRVSWTFAPTVGVTAAIILVYGSPNLNILVWGAQTDYPPVARAYVSTTAAAATADDYTAVRGNLWLNSSGTQTITTVVGQKYTVSVGSAGGTVTLSGGGSGVASFGSPVTFTATTTSVTGTVASSPSLIQFEPVLYTNTTLTYPTPYIPTTSAAVYVYDTPVSGAGLLVESARTNLLLQSNAFTTTWTNTSGPTPVAAAQVSPDQTVDAWSWTRTATTAQYNYQGVTSGASLAYTGSITAKAGTGRYLALRLGSAAAPSASNNVQAIFDLFTGTVSTAASNISWTLPSATITALTNGFYRCTLTGTCDTNANPSMYYSFSSVSQQVDGTMGVLGDSGYIFGAQLEQSVFPTSYIVTTTTRVAATVDNPYITGNMIGSGNWAWLMDVVNVMSGQTGAFSSPGSINDLSASNEIQFYTIYGGPAVNTKLVVGGSTKFETDGTAGAALSTGSARLALMLSGASVYASANGAATVNIGPWTAFTPTALRLGMAKAGFAPLNGYVRRAQVWRGGNYSSAWLQAISI